MSCKKKINKKLIIKNAIERSEKSYKKGKYSKCRKSLYKILKILSDKNIIPQSYLSANFNYIENNKLNYFNETTIKRLKIGNLNSLKSLYYQELLKRIYDLFDFIDINKRNAEELYNKKEIKKSLQLYCKIINILYEYKFIDFKSDYIDFERFIKFENVYDSKKSVISKNIYVYKKIIENYKKYNMKNIGKIFTDETKKFTKKNLIIKYNFINIQNSKGTIIAIGGTGGGFYGPAYVYDDLAYNAFKLNYSILRVDVIPNYLKATEILKLAILENLKLIMNKPVIFIGWSMGGATIVNTANYFHNEKKLKIKGLISIAGQTRGIDPIKNLDIPIYVIHGNNDHVLPLRCAEKIFNIAKNPKEKIILNNASHFMDEKRNELYSYVYKWINECFFKN